MEVSFIAIVMILAIVAIAVVIYKSIADRDDSAADDSGGGKLHLGGDSTTVTEEKEKTTKSVSLHTPNDNKAWTKDNSINHSLERIYACVYPTGIWVCPDCECENDFGRRACCVCNKQR